MADQISRRIDKYAAQVEKHRFRSVPFSYKVYIIPFNTGMIVLH